MPSAKFQIERKCELCGNTFYAKTITSKYCSDKCSKSAYAQKKKQAKVEASRKEKAARIPDERSYISISEATTLFDVSRYTLYRLIRKQQISFFNLGKRQISVSRADLEKKFNLSSINKKTKNPHKEVKTYRLEPEDCYTIGEIAKKFGINDSTVYLHIRKYSIPTRQIGNYVYAPKSEIDKLYKPLK